MNERDDHLAEGFLVDGVAPSVIGGEGSPGPAGDDFDYDFEPGTRREPPTTPIPALRPQGAPQPQAGGNQPKGWLGRMFGGE